MFRFGGLIKKYEVTYILVRPEVKDWDSVGVPLITVPERIPFRGVIQPLGAKLLQLDGGRYTDDDRQLFTIHRHDNGDLLEHNGKHYTVFTSSDRSDYNDVYQYVLKRVSSHDPVPSNS